MQTEETITFAVYCNSTLQKKEIKLSAYDTVEKLKIKIHKLFGITPDKQIIEGWINIPKDDQTILQFCSHINRINYLILKSSELSDQDAVQLEIEAIKSCSRKICDGISTSVVKFHAVTLEDGLEYSFESTSKPSKVILLYMHNNEGSFAKKFFKLLITTEIAEILKKNFFVIGWDVGDRNYHEALCKSLKKSNLEHLCKFVKTKLCTAIIIQKVNGETKTQAVEEIRDDLVLKYLRSCRDFLNAESKEIVEETNSVEDEMNSTGFQKIMADRLGDRDYDLYEFDQHDHLKRKIGYALFGPPQDEKGFGEKEKKKVEDMYNIIKKSTDKFAECKEQVEMSCIFNCTEPLPEEKTSRKKKNSEYNPDSDILPVPVFVLRKCRGSENPCRIFIDDVGRTYESWNNYINYNKLDKCIMVLPTNGKYSIKEDSVLLERHESPSCSIINKIFQAGSSLVGWFGKNLTGLFALLTLFKPYQKSIRIFANSIEYREEVEAAVNTIRYSILFFGNTFYNSKTCQTIVEESQAGVLLDYFNSLRNNRHRKTFNKLMKETISPNDEIHVVGRVEIIKGIKNIPNKDEIVAVLRRSNKMMNKNGVKFFPFGEEITLNGRTINVQEFIMKKQESSVFLSNLPIKADISPSEIKALINLISLEKWSLRNGDKFAEYLLRLIGSFGSNLQGMLLQIVHNLIPRLENIFKNVLIEIFPNNSLAIKVLCMLMEYFGCKGFAFLKNYNEWRQTGSYSDYEDDFSSVPEDKSEVYIWIFVKLVRACFRDGNLQESELEDILYFAEKYVLYQIVQYTLKQERNTGKKMLYPQTPKKIPCKVCSGYYYNYD